MSEADADAEPVTAAMVVIGNEILSGRTQDLNVAFVGTGLNEIGVQLLEVRVVPDIKEEIVAAVNALRTKFDYVFTTGGIGPTHDDITAESVAAAFGKQAVYHPTSYAILEATMQRRNIEFTEARKRMALAPEGADVIENDLGVAPGFVMENVYVMAGVPQVAQSMFRAAAPHLRRGRVKKSRSIATHLAEGTIAAGLEAIQKDYESADIGSYPFYNAPGGHGTTLVVRSFEETDLNGAGDAILALIAELKGEALSDERS
jgi:molybdenum cofactor synthesis domain-containing protein